MAWYPGAKKMELQPESDEQQSIRPTQFIYHSIAAPWTPERTYEFWRDSTNLESHFGLGFDGRLAQYIGTETRADACYLANRRPDGTGAISLESASNLEHSDPWTPEQIETNIQIGVWAHKTHGIPLRICRSWTDPGFGYHRLWPEWAKGGTACPGDARVRQFKDIVFPGIVARANGETTTPSQEDDMAISDDDLRRITFAVLGYKGKTPDGGTDPQDVYAYIRNTKAQVAGLSAAVQALAGQIGADVDTAEVVAAVKAAIAAAVVKVDVTVDDLTPGA